MSETLLIDAVPGEMRAALLEGDRPIEIAILREAHESRVGQVFLGRVQRILPGRQSAFVDIGLDRAGFLSLSEADEPLHEGQAVILQVAKDTIGRKGVQLTRRISIAGRMLVLTPSQSGLQVSRRIGDETEQTRLKGLMMAIGGSEEGFIVRTAAAGASEAQVAGEADRLRAVWDAIEFAARDGRPPTLLYAGPAPLQHILNEYGGPGTARIIVGDPATFASAKRLVGRSMPDVAARLELHAGAEPLFDSYGVEAEIEQVLGAHVRLPSGGEIVIESTEALTAIDVNTGSYVGDGRAEDTLLHTNLEAAVEIARQLRLRGIGGMVVIDFAHMSEDASWGRVLRALGGALLRDRSAARVLGRTAGGLVEVTRQRTREPLAQILTGDWRGGARSRTAETLAFDALRAIRREAARRPGRVRVSVAPDVATMLEGPRLAALAESIGRDVSVNSESAWPRERIEIAVD
jgi:ribonuclease G